MNYIWSDKQALQKSTAKLCSRVISNSIISVLVLVVIIISSAHAASLTIRPDHPRIWITAESLPELRSRALTTSASAYANLVYQANGRMVIDDDWDGEPTSFLGLMYQLNKDGMLDVPGVDYEGYSAQDYGRMAIGIMLHTASIRNLPYLHAVTYDWTVELMTPAERRTIVESLIKYNGKDGGAASGNEWTGSPTPFYSGKGVIPGLALYGDNIDINVNYGEGTYTNSDQAAQAYFNEDRWLKNIIPAGNMTAGDDGGWGSGLHYDMGYITGYIKIYEAMRTATGDNSIILNNNRLRYTPQYWLYMGGWQEHDDDLPGGLSTEDNWKDRSDLKGRLTFWQNQIPLSYIAYIYNKLGETNIAGLAVWEIENIVEYNSWIVNSDPVELLLWDYAGIAAVSPQQLNLPLTKLLGGVDDYHTDPYTGLRRRAGIGNVIMRSKWDDTGDAMIASFTSHPWAYYGHLNNHEGTFYIGYKGDLALVNSGTYEIGAHSYEYYKETVASNNMLVCDPSLAVDDKGQYYQNTGSHAHAYNDLLLPGSVYEFAGITKFETSDNYDFSETDLTKNYNVDGFGTDHGRVGYYKRDFIWLKSENYKTDPGTGNYFIVLDRFEVADENWPQRWLLHTVYRPELNGQESFDCSLCRGDVDAGISESQNTDMVKIEAWNNGPTGSKMFVDTILPQNHITRVVGGPGYEFVDADYVNWPVDLDYVPGNQPKDYWGNWRLEIEPTGVDVKKENIFLNVLYPTDDSTSAMPPTDAISSLDDVMQGVLIRDTLNPRVLMFCKNATEVRETTYSLPASSAQPAKHLLTDFPPNQNFTIFKDGVETQQVVSSSQGTIYFETTGGTSFRITSGPDTNAPIRRNGQPTGNLPAGTTQTTIRLDTNEAATCKFSENQNVDYQSMANEFSSTGMLSHSQLITGLADQDQRNYYIRCQDAHGNQNTDDYIISFGVNSPQSQSPACTITAPTSDATFDNGSHATIDLEGTASDDIGINRITWRNNATGDTGTASGTSNWSINDLPLVQGNNTIVITAWDDDDNTGTDQITVVNTGNNPSPQVDNGSGGGGCFIGNSF